MGDHAGNPFFLFNAMGRNINSSILTKDNVLKKVSQITIFSTYLNLSDKVIQYCIDTGELICSPIRDDAHPTCGFKYDNRGKLKFRDFAGYFWGDVFDIVALIMSNLYNKSYDVSNKNDFIKILRHITFTFKDIFYNEEKDINLINDINTTIVNIKNKKPIIELVVREWNNYDESYWKQFNVPLQYLNLNFVYPVEQYYINRKINPKPKYYYKISDPCYAYYLGKDRHGIYSIKLYFPKRTKGTTRFITNCNHLEGITNLDRNDYDIIVLTKSTKDRLSIGATIMKNSSLYGGVRIGCINIPHETYRLRQNEFDWLNTKINNNGHIISLMDNDMTGKYEAIWLRNNYHIMPFIIPVKYHCKDFAELVAKHKIETVNKLIVQLINYLKDYGKDNKLIGNTESSSSLPY